MAKYEIMLCEYEDQFFAEVFYADDENRETALYATMLYDDEREPVEDADSWIHMQGPAAEEAASNGVS